MIDFGVAKATEQKLTERTLFTQFGTLVGTLVGTLEYMSPEQAEMSALGVDTRSDIFSLGVLLYELLTGGTPLSRQRMKEAAYAEILRLIKEEEPPKPSTRLSDSGEALASISAQRQTEPAKLTKLVRGELDWIVMKTLEKDRNRRYETASGFAADVQRYLDDEPVQACPPSASYRFRKFARRNKGPVLAASLVALALVGGVIGATIGLIQAKDARQAEIAQRQLAEANAQRAEANAQKAFAAAEAEKKSSETAQAREAETRAVLDFVEGKVFAAARPEGEEGGLGREVTLRKAVEAALPFVVTGFADQPLIEARLRITLGNSFWYLGDATIAAEQYEDARALYAEHSGADHPDTLICLNNLANSYADLGRHTEALKLREETLTLRKAKLGPDHADTLGSMRNLASSFDVVGRHTEALKLREESLALQKANLGPDHPDTLAEMTNLASSYAFAGRSAQALELREETLTLQKAKLGPEHPVTLKSMNNLANSYTELGRHSEALQLQEETLALMQAILGPDHLDTLRSMNNLASSYAVLGRSAEALQLREKTQMLQKAKLGPEDPLNLASMSNLADSYAEFGRHAEALQLREEAVTLAKAKLGPEHLRTLMAMTRLASSYAALDRDEDALQLRQKVLVLQKATLGPDHPDTIGNMHNLASSYESLGRNVEALQLREETLPLAKARLGPDHSHTIMSMGSLAVSYHNLGRHDEALQLRKEVLALWNAKYGPDHPHALLGMGEVAESLFNLDRGAEAVPIIDECVRRAAGKVVHPQLIPDAMNLRLRHFEKIGDAARCLETALQWEHLKRVDAESVYQSACFRAVCAALISKTDTTPPAAANAKEQADQAMAWLKQAVAAGFQDAAHMKQDTDLDALREREDFKMLLADLRAASNPDKETQP